MVKRNELKWGSVLAYSQMILSFVIGLVYTPIMIRLLGKSEYGLYNTVSSTISMLSILNLGFNAGYIKYFAKYKKERRVNEVYSLNGLFLLVFTIIGMIALVCGLFLTYHLDLVFDKGLTPEEFAKARILMFLLSIHLALSFPMSVFSTILSANERFILLKSMNMIKTVLSPLVNLPLLLLGFQSIGLVVSSIAFALVTDSIFIYTVLFKLKSRFKFSNIEKELFTSIFTFTFFIAVNLIVDQINNGIDKVLLGRFRGTSAVAVYSVGGNLYSHYTRISTAVSGVFTPRIHRIYNQYDNKVDRNNNLTELFVRVGRIQFLILMLIASGLVFFGKSFIYYWVGDGYTDSYYVALLLILPASVPLIQNLGIEIQRAANKHQFRSVIYSIMAILNLLLSIYLCKKYGAIGSAIGTAISLIVANGLLMNIYYYKALEINTLAFWKSIIRMLLGMLPAFICGAIMLCVLEYRHIWQLAGAIAIYMLIYVVSIWLFSMNDYEKQLISGPVKKMMNKRKV